MLASYSASSNQVFQCVTTELRANDILTALADVNDTNMEPGIQVPWKKEILQ